MLDVHHFVEGYVELNVAGSWLDRLHVSAVVHGPRSAASDWNRRRQYDPRKPASIDTSTDGIGRRAETPGTARVPHLRRTSANKRTDAHKQRLKEVPVAPHNRIKAGRSQQSFERRQFHGIVPTAELVHDRCVASMLLSEPEGQLVLVSLPPPDLFGGVAAVAVDSTAIGPDVGCTPFSRRIVAHRDEQHATRRERDCNGQLPAGTPNSSSTAGRPRLCRVILASRSG